MRNEQIIKAIAVGISASMMLDPVVALAEGLSGESSGAEVKTTDSNEAESDIIVGATVLSETPSHADVKEQLSDVATELVTVDALVNEADKSEEVDYSDADKVLDIAIEEVRDAEKGIQTSDDAQHKAQDDAKRLNDAVEKTEDSIGAANATLDEVDKATENAVKIDESIDTAKSTEAEATIAVRDVESDVKKADEQLELAKGNLSDAETYLETADKEYTALLNDKNASDTAIENAKNKMSDAETRLETAKKNVEDNAKKAENLDKEAQKLAVYDEISDLMAKVEILSPDDDEYSETGNSLTELLSKYYLFNQADEGTEISCTKGNETYIVDYVKDSAGNLEPVTKSIDYITVTYISAGEKVTKKIAYGYDENGVFTITEKTVSAEETEKDILPKPAVPTNDDGKEYEETETSHIIYMDAEDKEEGFYAIDTASSDILQKATEKDLLPKIGSAYAEQDEDKNSVTITYKSIEEIEKPETTVTYELSGGGIAELVSKQFKVEYTSKTNKFENSEGFSNRDEAAKAGEERSRELKELYGERYVLGFLTANNNDYILSYYIVEDKSDVRFLPAEKTVYFAEEYKDRTEQTYVDAYGNEFVDNEDMVLVYKDPKNKKAGFYAADTWEQYIDDESFDPYGYSLYERDEKGRHKETRVEYLSRSGVVTSYTRETVSLVDRYESFETYKELGEGESLYDILIAYKYQTRTWITLKGKDDEDLEYTIDFGSPKWYEEAEAFCDEVSENAGGCIIAIEQDIPEYYDEECIVRRDSELFDVVTDVYISDSQSGECATEEEARAAISNIINDLYNNYYGYEIKASDVSKKDDGTDAWKFSLDYMYIASHNAEFQSIAEFTEYYNYTEYKNKAAEAKIVYDVSEKDDVLFATDNAEFNQELSDKIKAYNAAVKAKEDIEKATQAYEDALKSVASAKASVENLKKLSISQEILDKAKARYLEAETSLGLALKRKEDVEASYALAKSALASAEQKLAAIKAKPASGGTSGSTPVGRQDIADAGAATVPVDGLVATAASIANTQASTTQNTASVEQPQGAVLGAVRAVGAKSVATKKVENDDSSDKKEDSSKKADLAADNGKSSVADNLGTDSTENKNSGNSSTQAPTKTIKEEKPALAEKPETANNPLSKILLAVTTIGTAAAVGAVMLFSKKNIK